MSNRISSIISHVISPAASEAAAVNIVYASRPKWPLPASFDAESSKEQRHPKSTLRIAVLDSSFNPPTLAHQALAQTADPLDQSKSQPFDARLLLLSVRNADKALKPGDATFTQRAEMMIELAHGMEDQSRPDADPSLTNVAVGVIDEPTFVGKSTKLLKFLKQRVESFSTGGEDRTDIPKFQLSFIMGYDTLIRFFNPRFYDSENGMHHSLNRFFATAEEGNGEGSSIVWSRRGALTDGQTASKEDEAKFFDREDIKQYVESGKIKMLDIGEYEMKLSSTDVRGGVKKADQDVEASSVVWKTMCPRRVVQYIEENGLYKEQ
ncbi:hypothetical protein FRC03_001321 [Tulasnella sp. 419]|nr:hypothetical protein FRC03_001321 [Tulasnella sp. 419]